MFKKKKRSSRIVNMYIGVVNIYKSKSKYIQYNNNCIVKFGLVKYILYIYKGKFVVGCKVICIFEWKKKYFISR